MRSEMLGKIENHLQFLGYETEWMPLGHDGDECVVCRTETPLKPNWIVMDFMGVAAMRGTFSNSSAQRLRRREFIEAANVLNGNIGPMKWSIDSDGDIRIEASVVYYEKVSFGKLLDLLDLALKMGLEDASMAPLIASD